MRHPIVFYIAFIYQMIAVKYIWKHSVFSYPKRERYYNSRLCFEIARQFWNSSVLFWDKRKHCVFKCNWQLSFRRWTLYNTILYENEFQNPQIFQQTISLFPEQSTLQLQAIFYIPKRHCDELRQAWSLILLYEWYWHQALFNHLKLFFCSCYLSLLP
jgi:hypothetical protein